MHWWRARRQDLRNQPRQTARKKAEDHFRCIRVPSPKKCETTIEKIEGIHVAKRHKHRGPRVSRTQNHPPRQAVIRFSDQSASFFQLCLTYARLFPRRISELPEPGGAPYHAQNPKHIEGCSPTVANLNGYDEQGSKRAAQLRAHQSKSKGAAAFMHRKPASHGNGGVGRGAGLTHPNRIADKNPKPILSAK